MNFQAEKLVHPVTDEELASQSTARDGVLLLVFACPHCGWIGSRREGDEPTAPA
jgi:hypothetical protein